MSTQDVFLLLTEKNQIENIIFDESLARWHRDNRNYREERNFRIQKAQMKDGKIPFRIGEVFREHSSPR